MSSTHSPADAAAPVATEFTVQTAHAAVKDLMRPRMVIYWTDFLLSMGTATAAFVAVGPLGYVTVPAILAYLVSVIAVYRAGMFIHELVHFQSRGSFRPFRLAWNLLCGIPMLIPVFMYTCHSEHHNKRAYGTPRDAEYLPFAQMSPWRIIGVFVASPLVPLLGPWRFGVLAPLGWLIPPLRRYVYRQASSLKLDLEYSGREPADRRERLSWMAQEAGCLLVIGTVAVLAATGVVDPVRVLQWYLTALGVVMLNNVRLFGAHRYHGDEDGMTILEQMEDTVNFPRRRVITELWGPVGLRLHALHHLLPGLPYHAYGAAHERLISTFGPHSPYAKTSCSGLWVSVGRLWRESRAWTAAGRPVITP